MGALTIWHQNSIRDWFIIQSYTPPKSIRVIANSTGLSDHGLTRFYVGQPELNSGSEFNQNCPFPDKSLVLGCYAAGQIYIFEVNDDQLDGVEEVTAVHEMLHAAYARLSDRQRTDVDTLLSEQRANITDERILQTIALYEESDPASLYNELHSIFGTEIIDLIPELENYYSQYFTDRSIVVDIALSYEQVFTDLQDQIEAYDTEIAGLRATIDQLESDLNDRQITLDAEASALQSLRESGQVAAYNARVPGYNRLVNAFNALIAEYKATLSRHNELVNERNELALEQNDLVRRLDSKFEQL
jgi:Skp family chaperone for outer membrane proteins